MVMPFYEGPTLKAWLREEPQPPDEAWLKRLLGPLLDALALIHADHCYHRDIAPDNILLLGAGPLLLDFGAARRVIGDMTQALTVILKPGYAPIEQYAEVPSLKQGPWTDIYALSAVLHMAITGRAPVVSVGRMMNDEVVPLATAVAGRYSPQFLAAIDAGLAVRPEQRPQSVAAFRAIAVRIVSDGVIVGKRGDRAAAPGRRIDAAPSDRAGATAATAGGRGKRVALIVGVACLALAGVVAWLDDAGQGARRCRDVASRRRFVGVATRESCRRWRAPAHRRPPGPRRRRRQASKPRAFRSRSSARSKTSSAMAIR